MLPRYKPFADRQKNSANPNFAYAATDEDLLKELENRKIKRPRFPLEVFPANLQPFIEALITKKDGDRGFIGLSILSAVSTAIGTALRPDVNGWQMPASIWGACVGISSSGKTMVINDVLKPLQNLQDEYNRDYFQKMEAEESAQQRVILMNDTTFETLINETLGFNFKGICKFEDELVKWLSDMEMYDKTGREQSFWTKAWSGGSYTVRRRGGKMAFIESKHMVASVIGGTQPGLVHKFFEKGRGTSGFSYRFLFTLQEKDAIANPDLLDTMKPADSAKYYAALERIYGALPMEYRSNEPLLVPYSKTAIKANNDWNGKMKRMIEDEAETQYELNEKGGIFGKMKEYIPRIALCLQVLSKAMSEDDTVKPAWLPDDYVNAAIKVAEYFYQSNWLIIELVNKRLIIPPEVKHFAKIYMQKDGNLTRIGEHFKHGRSWASRVHKEYRREYPEAFDAKR